MNDKSLSLALGSGRCSSTSTTKKVAGYLSVGISCSANVVSRDAAFTLALGACSK